MDFRAFAYLMLLFLSSAAVLLCSQVAMVKASASIIRVPNDFPTIQEAINAAENGSTILVDSGVYYEHLTMNKTLTLLGVDKKTTIIDGSNTSTVITIEADDVVLDGFTVRRSGPGLEPDEVGVHLISSSGSIIRGNIVTLNGAAGIVLDNSNNNTLSQNIVSTTGQNWFFGGTGMELSSSDNNVIRDNIIIHSVTAGLTLENSSGNSIVRNTVEDSGDTGVGGLGSDNNTFSHNNFINNGPPGSLQVWFSPSNNAWSEGGEGNYWSDYVGLDDGSGGRTAGDGVGDTNLSWNGVDNYPLINPANPFSIFWENEAFPASLVSNSTVSAFNFDQTDREIAFDVTGPANSTGCFNVSIPKALLSGSWTILLDGTDATSKAAITESQTYTTIYLTYGHNTHNVQLIGTHVIPEYPTATIFLLTILLTLLPTTLILTKKNKVPDTTKEFRARLYVSVRDLTEPTSEVLLALGKRIHAKLNRQKVLH